MLLLYTKDPIQERIEAYELTFQIQNELMALKSLGFDEKLVLKLISDPKTLRSSIGKLKDLSSIVSGE